MHTVSKYTIYRALQRWTGSSTDSVRHNMMLGFCSGLLSVGDTSRDPPDNTIGPHHAAV